MAEDKNGKGRVIRNPSLEEIEQLKRSKATDGLTADEMAEKIEEAQPQTKQKTKAAVTGDLKPKSSVFEPDPKPMKLVSGNKFISVPNNEIYVRRMGAAEESLFYQLLANNNIKAINTTMDAVIASCVKSNINVYDLSLIDKLPIFFKILDLTYGPIDVVFTCDECLTEYHFSVDLVKDLKTKYLPASMILPHKIRLTSFPGAKIDWYVLYPTIQQSSDYMDATSIETLKMVTVRFEGTVNENGVDREVTEDDYQEIINNLNETDLEAFSKFENEFGSYSVDLDMKIKLCTNKSCTLNNKEVAKELPIESIFDRIIRLQTKK